MLHFEVGTIFFTFLISYTCFYILIDVRARALLLVFSKGGGGASGDMYMVGQGRCG
jgi:hypothetical protein